MFPAAFDVFQKNKPEQVSDIFLRKISLQIGISRGIRVFPPSAWVSFLVKDLYHALRGILGRTLASSPVVSPQEYRNRSSSGSQNQIHSGRLEWTPRSSMSYRKNPPSLNVSSNLYYAVKVLLSIRPAKEIIGLPSIKSRPMVNSKRSQS